MEKFIVSIDFKPKYNAILEKTMELPERPNRKDNIVIKINKKQYFLEVVGIFFTENSKIVGVKCILGFKCDYPAAPVITLFKEAGFQAVSDKYTNGY